MSDNPTNDLSPKEDGKFTAAVPKLPPVTFDVSVCDRLKAAIDDILLHFPEVKCIACAVTWNGVLNDATGLAHGVWVGRDGPVTSPDGVMAGLRQTAKLYDMQVRKALDLVGALQERVIVLGSEIARREETKAANGPASPASGPGPNPEPGGPR